MICPLEFRVEGDERRENLRTWLALAVHEVVDHPDEVVAVERRVDDVAVERQVVRARDRLLQPPRQEEHREGLRVGEVGRRFGPVGGQRAHPGFGVARREKATCRADYRDLRFHAEGGLGVVYTARNDLHLLDLRTKSDTVLWHGTSPPVFPSIVNPAGRPLA